MMLSLSAIQTLRMSLAAATLGTVVVSAGHAAAKNHDLQIIRRPQVTMPLHDRAPGPRLYSPN